MSNPPGKKQNLPFVVDCAAGKYAWCQCGKSGRYPYCDGAHRGSDITPVKVELESARKVAWCACGKTGNKPFCDGTHSRA